MAKKSFTDNVIMDFLADGGNGSEPEKVAPVQHKKKAEPKAADNIPIGYAVMEEPKSRRVNTLLQPSVYEGIASYAKAHGISTNDAINTAIKDFIERN